MYEVQYKGETAWQEISKAELAGRLSGNFKDADLCFMAMDDGETVETNFAIYRKRPFCPA